MKKLYILMVAVLVMAGCKSREEKAAELIKQEMFKTLYDFESYEPIETKYDSAYTSVYTDSIIKSYAYIAESFMEDVDENLDKIKDAQSTIEIWSDSYSSLGRRKYNEAMDEYKKCLDKTKRYLEIVESYMDSIKITSSNFKPKFYGWRVTHKFRCKTKGGNFDLGNYVYVFDKEMKKIIYKEDLDDDKNDKIKNLIDEAINREKIDAITSPTEIADTIAIDVITSPTEIADSLANELKTRGK